MVAAKHYGATDFSPAYGLVESKGYLGAPFGVGIKDARLRTDHEMVWPGLFYPVDVVVQLMLYLLGRSLADAFQHSRGYAVGSLEVLRVARGAHPSEWTEAVVEEHRAHDVLHV